MPPEHCFIRLLIVLPHAAGCSGVEQQGRVTRLMLFVGDVWSEEHHDIELMDASGRRLSKARLPEGVAGIARLHTMVGDHLGDNVDESEVAIGIETDHGPWVAALVAAGYTVFAVNPLQASRFRDRRRVSGAKSDAADAHVLADMVRTDSHQLRPVAGDSPEAEAIKVVARAHKTLIFRTHPPYPAVAACVARVLPSCTGGVRRPRRKSTPSSCSAKHPTRPRQRD